MNAYFAKDKEINLLFAESEKMYRKLVESIKNGIYMADVKGNLFFVNQAFVDILGYNSKEEMLGLNLAKDFYVDSREAEELFKELEKKGFVREREIRNRCKDGAAIILSTTSNFIRNDRGDVIGIEGIVHDITDKKSLEDDLLAEKIKLEEILSFDEDISAIRKIEKLIDFIVEKTTLILNADKCSLMLFDEARGELCIKGAKGLSDEVITKTRIKLGEPIAGIVAKEGKHMLVSNIEYDKRFGRKSRPSYSSRSFISAVIKLKNRLIGVINVADKNNARNPFNELDLKVLNAVARQSAIAIENANLYRELEYLSVTDPVTNLSNYRYFVRSMDDEIERFKRFADGFSLLMFDVDDFKSYNDTYGHLAGDQFLRELGELLTENLRSIDKVCRYGGDEFVVLLPGTHLAEAKIVAEKLREKIEKYMFKKPMTISVGVVEFKKPLSRFEFTMKADQALYQAKREGKNRVYSHG